MTPRDPAEVNRGLRRWLWNEEQRWKRARHADIGETVVEGWRNRNRFPTGEKRKAALDLAKATTHHPHIHMIVPDGGGIALDGQRWISSRPAFLLPVHVLSKLFRRLFLDGLIKLDDAGRLRFFGDQAGLNDRRAFLRHLMPLRRKAWVVYAKPPFAGPEAVLAYTCRATRTVSPSRTGGSSPSTRPASPSATKTTAARESTASAP